MKQLQKDLEEMTVESKFLDISKTSKGKETLKSNKASVFQDMELYDFLRDSGPKDTQLFQLIRKYLSSYR